MSSAMRCSSSTTKIRALSIRRDFGPQCKAERGALARSFFLDLVGSVNRNAHAHRGSFALTANDVDFAVEHRGPFPHAQQPEGFGARKFPSRYPAAVVLHFEDQLIFLLPQVNIYLGRLRVAHDIGERLLENAEDRRGPYRVQVHMLETRMETAGNSGALFKLLNLPLNRRLQAQIVQDRRTQFGGNLPHRADDRIHPARQFPKLLLTLLKFPGVADRGYSFLQ